MTEIVGKFWGFCNTLRHDGIDLTEEEYSTLKSQFVISKVMYSSIQDRNLRPHLGAILRCQFGTSKI
jgi:hypothetical protein